MIERKTALAILLATLVALFITPAMGAAARPATQEQEEEPEEAQQETGATGPPVRVGRTPPLGFGQACYARWKNCQEGVQDGFESMWKTHQARRKACGDALDEAENACLTSPTPRRCAKPGRRVWKRCAKKADRDQRRKSKQVDQQWKACARAYQDCVGREPGPRWWDPTGR